MCGRGVGEWGWQGPGGMRAQAWRCKAMWHRGPDILMVVFGPIWPIGPTCEGIYPLLHVDVYGR
jgi:hypothetical protein